jgi:hypothetical protein
MRKILQVGLLLTLVENIPRGIFRTAVLKKTPSGGRGNRGRNRMIPPECRGDRGRWSGASSAVANSVSGMVRPSLDEYLKWQ